MKIFMILLILFSFFVGLNQNVHACSCDAEWSIEDDFGEETSVIFSGKVINIKEQQRTYLVTFEINQAWKGVPSNISSINTMTSLHSSACGYSFTEDESYLVTAYGIWDQTPEVGICSSPVALANAHQEISYLNKLVEDKASKPSIPEWIKKTAGWWSDGLIEDSEFIDAIEFLIVKEIMVIPESDLVKTDALPGIPNWIKDTAGWWAAGKVTDTDFVNGIQYLIKKGILQVSPVAESACSGKALCITGKVERIVDGDTLHVDGYIIRISLTDTPEKYEDRFYEATAFTRNLCPVGSLAIVDQDDKQPYDQYKRLLGKVICQGKNLNEELLENGFAELLTSYCRSSEFASEAWAQKFGC